MVEQLKASIDAIYAEMVKINPKLDTIEEAVRELKKEVKDIHLVLEKQERRILEAEQRISDLEDATNVVPTMAAQLKDLKWALVDQENRARRNNIRIFGVPELLEKEDMRAFLHTWLPKLLNVNFNPPLDIQRAHRVPTRATKSKASTPRPIVAYLLKFTQVQEILFKAKESK